MTDLNRSHLLRQARENLLSGRLPTAESYCRQLLAKRKNDVEALALLLLVALERGQPDEAEVLARRCVELDPKAARYQILLGLAISRQARFDEAIAVYEQATRTDPSNLQGIAGVANIHEQRGEHARGLAAIEPIVERGDETADIAQQYTRIQNHLKQYDRAIEVARRNLTKPGTTPGHRSMLLFGIGKALEKSNRPDEAFEAYTEANSLMRVDSFDLEQMLRTDELHLELTAEDFASIPRAEPHAQSVIFILGMPRSGTTLTEFIFDAHPAVRGIGECRGMTDLARELNLKIGSTLGYPQCLRDLEQSDVDDLARSYLETLERQFAPGEPDIRFYADKSLDNHRHVGLISRLIPDARFIWIRRNELDNCLGCFGEPLPASQQPWATTLHNIGVVYRLHERLMRHWRTVLDTPIFELHYEQLVEQPEQITRQLIEFCDLPWDDACLRHHESKRHARTLSNEQVRQPIYTSSVKRAVAFEPYLGPLREGLAAGERRCT